MTVVISLVTIVFGELVPKTLGIAHAERFAIVFARPVTLLGRIFAPIVWLLTGSDLGDHAAAWASRTSTATGSPPTS